jgi:hypothetical protein
MRKAFQPWKAMGLFALVLGLMTFSHTAAQAEVGAKWNVNGTEVAGESTAEFQTEMETEGILLTKIGLSKLELLCTTTKVIGGLLKKAGALSGKLHFGGCITKLNGNTANACVPHSPTAANGLIETNALTGLLQLHALAGGSTIPLAELTPETGKIFVTLILGKAAPEKNECGLGEKFDITGKSFLKDSLNEGEVEKVTHAVEEGQLSALLFGSNPFTIDGRSNAFLVGPDLNLKFSGRPA